MEKPVLISEEILKLTIDKFWEVFPPFWQQIRAHIRQVATENFAITVEQFHILRHIRKGQSSISELADARHISRPGVSQAVDILVSKGLLTRTQSTQDRRHVRLDLTAEGSALLEAILVNTRQWMAQSLAALDEADLLALSQAMDALKKVISV